MYQIGDTVKYKTLHISSQNTEILPQIKTGVVEEVFSTLDNKPCYWIEGEKELILESEIIGAVDQIFEPEYTDKEF